MILPMTNERMLLNSLLSMSHRLVSNILPTSNSHLLVTIDKADPDVIVSHEFLGVSLNVLLHRMKELKAEHWSRIGRFRHSKWPNVGRQGENLKFLNGRVLCDLASDAACLTIRTAG
jgi:DNA polymerase alpha subunit A